MIFFAPVAPFCGQYPSGFLMLWLYRLLFIPALVVLARLPMKQAVGTSLVVIAMNSASGFLGYLGQVDVPWGFMAVFTAIAIGGILVGTHLVRFVSQQALKRSFAVFLLVMAGVILYQNRGAFSL